MSRYKSLVNGQIVDAFQITEHTRWNQEDWPVWMLQGIRQIGVNGVFSDGDDLVVSTLHGNERVKRNDWIIRSEDGSLYGIHSDQFDENFEPA